MGAGGFKFLKARPIALILDSSKCDPSTWEKERVAAKPTLALADVKSMLDDKHTPATFPDPVYCPAQTIEAIIEQMLDFFRGNAGVRRAQLISMLNGCDNKLLGFSC